jgi:ribose transport system permease protein
MLSRVFNQRAVLRTAQFDWQRYVVYFGFLAIFIFFAITLRDVGFTSPSNLLNIVRQTAIIIVMAVGLTFVIGAGEIDLSIGAVAGLASVTTALILNRWGLLPGVVAGLLTGALVGGVNGLLVAGIRIPSFLVTLGMLSIANGVAMWITATAPVPIVNDTYTSIFGSGEVGPIPSLLFWLVIVLVGGHVVLRKTAYGRQVLATGGNEAAARFSGVNTRRIKLLVLLVSGVFAALGGMLYAGRLHSGRFQWGQGDELSAIAAVILGGTSLFGGSATVAGTVLGALMIGLINNGLILMGLEFSQQLIIRGAIIILAVALARRD